MTLSPFFLLYFNYKTAELKMNALREREINNNLERRLSEEQKLRGEPFCIRITTVAID
jgi:hypothetical protein